MIAPGGEATDKILILGDPDHSGKATTSTIFADGLLLPTGVAPTPLPTKPGHPQRYGCFVGQSTELLYFEDTTGAGKADRRHIVLSGFGTEDTHHIVHTLKWGPDGRLYMDQSIYIHTHAETPWGVVRLNAGGVLAWDPRTEKLEVFDKGLWNSWGHQFDQWGQSFRTDGAGFDRPDLELPGRHLCTFGRRAPDHAKHQSRLLSQICQPRTHLLPPLRRRLAGHRHHLRLPRPSHRPLPHHRPRQSRGFEFRVTSFGFLRQTICVARSRSRNSETRAEALRDAHGATRQTRNPPRKRGHTTDELADVVRTSDVAFRPIDVKLGPDGALYVADWSNPVINHGEVDFRDPRRDHTHGRIWRITKKDAPPDAVGRPHQKERRRPLRPL